MAVAKLTKLEKKQMAFNEINEVYDFFVKRPLGYTLTFNVADALNAIEAKKENKTFSLEKVVASCVKTVVPQSELSDKDYKATLADLAMDEIIFMVDSKMLAGVKVDYVERTATVKADDIKVRRNGTSFIKKIETLKCKELVGLDLLKGTIAIATEYANVMLEQFKDDEDLKSLDNKPVYNSDAVKSEPLAKSVNKEEKKAKASSAVTEDTPLSFENTQANSQIKTQEEYAKTLLKLVNDNPQFAFELVGNIVLVLNAISKGQIKKNKSIVDSISSSVKAYLDFKKDSAKEFVKLFNLADDSQLNRRMTYLLIQIMCHGLLLEGVSIKFSSLLSKEIGNMNLCIKSSKIRVTKLGENFLEDVAVAKLTYKGTFGDKVSVKMIAEVLRKLVVVIVNAYSESTYAAPSQSGYSIFG